MAVSFGAFSAARESAPPEAFPFESLPPRGLLPARKNMPGACFSGKRGAKRLVPRRGRMRGMVSLCGASFFSERQKRNQKSARELRAAAASGRRRRHAISTAAPLAGRREAGPGAANAARRQSGPWTPEKFKYRSRCSLCPLSPSAKVRAARLAAVGAATATGKEILSTR